MPIDHKERARRAWPYLARRASAKGKPYTYGELCRTLGLHHRAARYFLDVIQKFCENKPLPKLQALAVNKSTKLPGAGYRGSRTPEGHKADLQRVYRHKWSDRPPF